MITQEFLERMNTAYRLLEVKQTELFYGLFHRVFTLETGWYNGHYHQTKDGQWSRDAYPIPVISVKGFCDVEIQFDRISVSTKLKRSAALEYSYEKMSAYKFEAYGVEDYLADYYHEGQTIQELKDNIRNSDEKEIGFSFILPFETTGEQMYEFAKLLRREGFYY